MPGPFSTAQADRRPDRRLHDPGGGTGGGPEGQVQGEKAVVERGEDFARARQGKSHAGLRRGIEERFGAQGSYRIDFYHVCEYLIAAAKTIAPDAAAGKAWMEAQKVALKTGRADAVLAPLEPHREASEVGDDQAPIRACHRYVGARKDQLNYREALAEGLPIGSGEIESARRYVAQKRLKLPGAWWLVEHAEHMPALRIKRLNGDWGAYWAALAAKPPAPANLNWPEPSSNVAA
jgi:hypothetical protein